MHPTLNGIDEDLLRSACSKLRTRQST